MSALTQSGHRPVRVVVRRTVMECYAETAVSIRLDARELHHLSPFRGFFGDQFTEIGRRAGKRGPPPPDW